MNPYTESLRPVWDNPTSVFVDQERLEVVAQGLAAESLRIPSWNDPVFLSQDDERLVDFLGVGNAINFAFTDFTTHKKFEVSLDDRIWRGAFGMWACLLRADRSGVRVLDGYFLRTISDEEGRSLLAGLSPVPMLEERISILREVGAGLCQHYGGRFAHLFKASGYRAFGPGGILARLLEHLPSFRDESSHEMTGRSLMFHKRAQLLAMMYQGRALVSSRLPSLVDWRELGPISDYAIPKALQNMGILRYSGDLMTAIEDRAIIPRDSIWEQELRAQCSQAQKILLERIAALGATDASYLHLDYALWSKGRGGKAPHHLTRTTAY